ncbi:MULTISPECIES: hypothetical protein [unclassified Microbispora]|uniref:hypothetical protein n=1 Tax=unclassified Microbispora TaxID=2614687 RepID=UPI00163CF90F|nr:MULTISPECIES: hypothetical protein [unclassified Microbispora]
MKWRWPWQWPEAAPALDAMANEDEDEAPCGCQVLIDQLHEHADMLREDLAQADRALKEQAEQYEARIASLTRQLRDGTPFGEREEMLRTQETNARLAQRINDMTRGVVTL